ncbi:MAG: hypothetical protein M0Z31_09315 [Clostridia bacterium]|nr:hypothetical protein [Clostridia bacterium]
MKQIILWRRAFANEQGSALLLVVIISAVVVMLAVSMAMVSTLELMIAVSGQYKKEARYMAEAAVNRGVYEFVPVPPGYGVSRGEYLLSKGKYRVENLTQVGPDVYEVTGRGMAFRGGIEYPHLIKAKFKLNPTGYQITSWQED